MPAASILSDDWERRAKHREDCIAAVKRSADYAGALAATSLFPTSRPTTPNPRHPDQCSKRVWERSVRQWRQELRALLPKLDAPSAALVPTPMKVPTTAVPPRPVEGRPPFELSVAPVAVKVPAPMKVPTTAVPPWPVEGRPPFELSVVPVAVKVPTPLKVPSTAVPLAFEPPERPIASWSEPMYVELPAAPAQCTSITFAASEPKAALQRSRSRSPCRATGGEEDQDRHEAEETEEQMWERRGSHRRAGIAAVKRSADYIAALKRCGQRPTTPCPEDRTISKRSWERSVQEWRVFLRDLAADISPYAGHDVSGPV